MKNVKPYCHAGQLQAPWYTHQTTKHPSFLLGQGLEQLLLDPCCGTDMLLYKEESRLHLASSSLAAGMLCFNRLQSFCGMPAFLLLCKKSTSVQCCSDVHKSITMVQIYYLGLQNICKCTLYYVANFRSTHSRYFVVLVRSLIPQIWWNSLRDISVFFFNWKH